MPELWLNYGGTDIILDLKVENLSLVENSKFDIRTNEGIAEDIKSVPVTDETILVPLDGSNSTVQITAALISQAESTGISLSIESILSARKQLSNKISTQNITIIEKNTDHFIKRANEKSTIFISKSNVDPFFGYYGTPSNLLRLIGQNKMNEVFHSRVDDLPHPGEKCPPTEIANEFCENMEAKSIEIISNNSGIHNIYYGQITQSFQNATDKLTNLSLENQQGLKSLILGTNIDSISSATLTSSLDLLWNSINALKKNATVVIISENSKGFGSQALEKLAYGKLKLEDYRNYDYFDGLEHIMFINSLSEKYSVAILSSLPKYYLKEKFGFNIISNVQEAAEKILDINGKSHRISLIQDPNIAIFKKGN
jgi:hypothetical protein